MEKQRFIFTIDAEKHYNVLVRVIIIFNRQRIPVREFSSHIKQDEDQLRISIVFEETKEAAIKLSRRLDKEIDIISVNLFEQMV